MYWMDACMFTLLYIAAFTSNICTTPKIDNPPDISPFASWSRKTHSPAVQTSKFRWKFEEDSIAKLTIRIVSFHQLDEDINWSFLSIVRDRRKNCWSERTCSTNSNSVNSQSQVTGRWTEWSCHCSLCGMIGDKKNMRCQCTKNFRYFVGFPPDRHSFWSCRCFKGGK